MARSRTMSRANPAGYVAPIRDANVVTNTDDPLAQVLYRPLPWPVISPAATLDLSAYDNRRWQPSTPYPVVYGGGRAAVDRKLARSSRLASNPFTFANPQRVLVCVRRGQRREVLFAKGRVGGGHRKPRWNAYSYWRC